MRLHRGTYRAAALTGFLVFSLSACGMGAGDDDDAVATAEDVATEVAAVELTFTRPPIAQHCCQIRPSVAWPRRALSW
jgi:hypothetical protein